MAANPSSSSSAPQTAQVKLKSFSARVTLVGAVVSAAAGAYVLVKYASGLAAAAFLATLFEATVLSAIYYFALQSRAITAPHRRAIGLALVLSAAVVFGTTVIVSGFGFGSKITPNGAIFAGLSLSFSGFLLAISRMFMYRPVLAHPRGWDGFQAVARLTLGAALVGLGGGILGLAITRAPTNLLQLYLSTLVHKPGTASSTAFQTLLAASTTSATLTVEGFGVGFLGILLVSAKPWSVTMLSSGLGITVIAFGLAAVLNRSIGYGIAIIALGTLAPIVGIVLMRRFRRWSTLLLALSGGASNVAAISAFFNHQLELLVSFSILTIACLAYAVALHGSAAVLPVSQEAHRRRWRRGKRIAWVLGFVLLGLASAMAAIAMPRDRFHIGDTIVFLGIALGCTLILAMQGAASLRAQLNRRRLSRMPKTSPIPPV